MRWKKKYFYFINIETDDTIRPNYIYFLLFVCEIFV